MAVFKSGAFVQQCFSIHPLCLNVKKVMEPDQVVLSCSSCQLSHRLVIGTLTSALPGLNQPLTDEERTPWSRLSDCVQHHRTALGIAGMDVVRETAKLRCGECRRTYDLAVFLFETHQR